MGVQFFPNVNDSLLLAKGGWLLWYASVSIILTMQKHINVIKIMATRGLVGETETMLSIFTCH